MTISQKAQERINGMTKGQVQRALADIEDGLGNPANLEALNARMLKFAPPAPTPFPRQAELDKAYSEWKAWGKVIKDLHTEARAGNHSYVNSDGESVKPGRARKATVENKGDMVDITLTDGSVFTSFTAVAVANPDIRPDLSREISRNWREHVMLAREGTIRITDITAEEYAQFFPIPEGRNWTYEAAAEEVAAE